MTQATLPPAAFGWADEIAEEWIEWVEGSGIDVVGDVDDLRPVRPDPDAAVGEPGPAAPPRHGRRRARRAGRADLEAANRPDPNEQLGARIGRAARRLRGQ